MISIKNISFAFKKNKPLFGNLSAELYPGRTYGLFGLNGAGKTTLLNLITGMLFPDKGECTVLGEPAKDRSAGFLKNVFLVPEQFELPALTPKVYTDLHAPFYPDFNQEQLYQILQEFHIDLENKLTENSYGQRKKFLIAFALAANTKVLLMDEPTNGLDIPSKSQFRKIMAATDHSERCTVISTHQVRDLETMIDQITVIHNGSIIFDQSISAISESLSFRKADGKESEAVLYSEYVPGGEMAITQKAKNDPETEINLELLFNGIVTEPEKISSVFKSTEVAS